MRSLVLGSSGRVGTALCTRLRAHGDAVGEFDIARDLIEDARSATLPLRSYDRVFLLAWDVGGAKYLHQPHTQAAQLAWNTAILDNVMPQVEAAGVHLTFVSSQLAHEPTSAYGLTKRLGEERARALGGVTVRIWNAYGSVEPITERSQAVSDFVVQAVQSGEIRVLTSGGERRRFVHLDDIAEGLELAASTPDLRGATVDLADPTTHSIADVAGIITAITGAAVMFGSSPGAQAPLDPYRNAPGWSPRRRLPEGIADMVARAQSAPASPPLSSELSSSPSRA